MPAHYGAAVCKRGHTRSDSVKIGPSVTVHDSHLRLEGDYCAECGAAVIRRCEACSAPIRGRAAGISEFYSPPHFCDECGEPHPWLSRAGRVHLLQNRLDAEPDLDPAVRLKLADQLEALRRSDLDDEEEVELLKRVKKLAPAAWEKTGVRQIVTTLATEWSKKQLGL